MTDNPAQSVFKKTYYVSPERPKPRPLITARALRANLHAITHGEEARVLGNRWTCRCIILPVPRYEWYRKDGMDKRMKETRRRFDELMAILER